MITEDYVSFEVAKLLKEKGFDAELLACYTPDGLFARSYGIKTYTNKSEDPAVRCVCPTLQMAMKWLRKIHNLHIIVDCIGTENYMPTIQFTRNSKDIEIKSKTSKIGGNGFDSYEEACEAAIKYCLENLI